MKHLDNFLDRLEGVRQQGDGWTALCPAHNDSNQSLSISLGESNRILIKCHAGCRGDWIIAKMGLKWRDLYATGKDRFVKTDIATPLGSGPKLVSPDLRDATYSQLLKAGSLTEEHRRELVRRGLSAEDIARNGYISSETILEKPLPEGLYEIYASCLLDVPGIQTGWTSMPVFTADPGLIIPVRDLQRRIVALQVRVGGSRKYAWPRRTVVSLHVPLQTDPDSPEVWITEGPLKADVAAALGKLPVVGVPGVNQWATLSQLLRGKPRRKIVIAFDADWTCKPQVAQQRLLCAQKLERAGHEVVVANWPLEQGKGLDDLLLAGGVPQLVEVSAVC